MTRLVTIILNATREMVRNYDGIGNSKLVSYPCFCRSLCHWIDLVEMAKFIEEAIINFPPLKSSGLIQSN